MIKKIKKYYTCMGFYSVKFFMYNIINKFYKKMDVKSIKTRKTGKYNIYFRPNSTDIKVIKQLIPYGGEYDFLYKNDFNYLKNSKIIIDAGANIGIFSRIIHELYPAAKTYSLEPEINNFKMLKMNLSGFNCVCLNNCIWNRNSKLKLSNTDSGEWSFSYEETLSTKYDAIGITVPQILDKYKIKKIDIFKIDIEGSEYELFDKTANKWIDKVETLIIEIHDTKKKWSNLRVMDVMYNHNFDYKTYGDIVVFYKKKYNSEKDIVK